MSEAEVMRDWASGLREFTHRNAGRRTVLEEEATGEGLRLEQSGYPFWGVSWDPRDGRVQIMLGEQGSVERHLTRSIRAARAIDLVRRRIVQSSGRVSDVCPRPSTAAAQPRSDQPGCFVRRSGYQDRDLRARLTG